MPTVVRSYCAGGLSPILLQKPLRLMMPPLHAPVLYQRKLKQIKHS